MSEELDPSGASKPKRGPGRPFTPEIAKAMQLSATAAKKRRRETRMAMLNALTTELDLGQEMVKAFKAHDEKQMELIERALKMVGLHVPSILTSSQK